MLSEKGKTLIVRNEFKFRFHKLLADDVQRWACTEKKCKAFLKRSRSGTLIDESKADVHSNHEPSTLSSLEKQRISNGVKRKALDDVSERPSKLICRELDAAALQVLTGNDVKNMRRSIYRQRRTVYPPLPQTLEELHTALENFEMRTKQREDFLLVNNEDENIVIFSTPKNLRYLQQCKVVLMDGTFKSSPSLFYQLFTIHGYRNGHYVPLVFCLLPNKEERTYEAALWHVRSYLPDDFFPHTLFADFERAIHGAVRKVWPLSIIRGCRFHLGQSWYRKIQSLGLQRVYRTRTGDGAFLRTFFGLPFLRPEDVEACFHEDLQPDLPTDARVCQFADYVFDTYVVGHFPPNMWAAFDADSVRTTNACEAFHSKLNKMFYHAHPHIFYLVDVLLEVQHFTYLKMRNPPNVTSNPKQKIIEEEMKKLVDNEISRYEFVKVLARKFQPKVKGFRNTHTHTTQ